MNPLRSHIISLKVQTHLNYTIENAMIEENSLEQTSEEYSKSSAQVKVKLLSNYFYRTQSLTTLTY